MAGVAVAFCQNPSDLRLLYPSNVGLLEGFRPAKRFTAADNRRSDLLQQVALPGCASVPLRKVAKAGNCVGRHSPDR